MYRPPHFAETRPEVLHRITRDHALGLLVAHTADGLQAHHLPFLLDTSHTSHASHTSDGDDRGAGALLAHVARANPLWQQVQEGAQVLVVFRGAEGYVSPNW